MCWSNGARKNLALSMHRWMCLEPAERKHTEAWDQRREQWELRASRRLPKGRAGHLLGILSHLPSSSTYPGSMQIWCKPKLTQTSFCYRILVSPPPDSPPLYTHTCVNEHTHLERLRCVPTSVPMHRGVCIVLCLIWVPTASLTILSSPFIDTDLVHLNSFLGGPWARCPPRCRRLFFF